MLSILVCLLVLSNGCAAFKTGTVTHKVTASQHSFKAVVAGFQDAEIAEYQGGHVPQDLHIKIQQGIRKVALVGVNLDTELAANASSKTLKDTLDNIYNTLDSIVSEGIIPIPNPTTKATLEIALDQIKVIIDSALTQVQ
jgi:hypothetical protein